MKYVCVGACCLAVICAPSAWAAAPALQTGVPIQDGGSDLMVSSHAAPEVAYWNNSGKKDLIVGEFTGGKVKLFLNTGSDAAPAFSGGSFIQSSGTDIQVSYG